MFTLKRLIVAGLFLFVLAGAALAQDRAPIETPREPVAPMSAAPLVTATVTAERVRFVSPGTVVQLRLEVYNEAGQKLFDTELHGGNVLDWHLQDGAGQRLQAGSYACVLTTKSLSGRLSQRVGLVTVNGEKAAIEAAGAAQLSTAQQQTIGPIEGNASFTVRQEREAEAITAVTHDGSDGQLTSTTGPLTFRTGDLFSGKDVERVRITPEGNVGIGTDTPQAKLDVAGTIRAEKGIEFADGTMQTSGLSGRKDKDGNLMPNVSGTGTTGRLTKWTNGPTGTLGDSVVTEATSGKLGIGTVSPNYEITLFGNDVGLQLVSPVTGTTANDGFRFGIDSTNKAFLWNVEATDMYFGTTATERMRIKATGNVGIGTSNPAEKLEVAGNIKASGSLTGGTGSITGNLTVDTNTLHVDAATNRVGIATVTPTESLHVAGNGLVTGNLSVNGNLSVAGELSAALPAGSANYIQNSTAEQSSSDFNISGNGTAGGTLSANIVSATTQYNFGAERVLAISASNFNTFLGVGAGAANPSGSHNSFFGSNAGTLNTSVANSFFGVSAGQANTTGGSNSFFGLNAGQANTAGSENSFFGRNAGLANTTGLFNSFFGKSAGDSNTTGGKNSFFGVSAGQANTAGGGNSFFGESAGLSNTTGGSNSFFGWGAGNGNGTGNSNTIIGVNADVGSNNLDHATAIGADAVVSTSSTIALGRSSGADAVLVPGNLTVSGTLTATLPSTSGSYIQNRSSSPQATSDFNISGSGTAGGTLSANIVRATQQYNVGAERVLATSVGNSNTFVGVDAGAANPTGSNNSFFGKNAGQENTTGFFNSFFGASAGALNTTGAGNSFFGRLTGVQSTGAGNSFFGVAAGSANTTGDSNSFFGQSAGDSNTTGGHNTIIGDLADVGSNDLDHATAIGAGAIVSNSDSIVLGRSLDTVRVPGKILAEANAGPAVGVGEYYRDNAIVAWARITASGTINSKFGISTVEHTTPGIYTITLTASAAANTFLIPVAIAEIDIAPTSAATLRIVSINQTSVNSFQVFVNNGTGALVDNDFVFLATAR